jgi:O-antigen/teichoic acid export membrane protein
MPTLKVPAYFRSSGSIAVAMAVMSVATYGFTMIAARILGTRTFGAFASLMATLLVVGVLQLGLQTTAARRISADPEHVEQIERVILRVTYRASLALGVVLLLLTPLINWVLRLDSLATAAMIGVTSIPVTIMGGQAGILQGERRWWPLAVLYVANGVPRLVLGTAMIMWRPTEFSAMVGVALGALAPVAVGAYALRRDRPAGGRSDVHGARAVIKETLHNSQALLAFLALSSVDVIVARNVLPEHEAGLYAGGLIMTKAVLFLPQFVVIVAFPSMSTPRERRRALTRSLTLVAGLGVASTLGAWILSGLALTFVGGDEYASIQEKLWLFAVLGTVLAMLQLLVYAVLARQGQRSVYFVWLTLIALVLGGLRADSLEALLIWVSIIDAVLFAVLLGLSLWLVKDPLPEKVDASADAR